MTFQPIRIFHLDDDEIVLEIIKNTLKNGPLALRFEIESFENLPTFFKAMSGAHQPDVLLLDLDLNDPHESGISLSRKYRKLYPSLTILLCSNLSSSSLVAEALQAGADNYFSKQDDLSRLAMLIIESYEISRGIKHSQHSRFPVVGITLTSIFQRLPFILSLPDPVILIEGEKGTGKNLVVQEIQSLIENKAAFKSVNSALELTQVKTFKDLLVGNTKLDTWILIEEIGAFTSTIQTLLAEEVLRIRENALRYPNRKYPRFLLTSSRKVSDLLKEGVLNPKLNSVIDLTISIPPVRQRSIEEIKELIQHIAKTVQDGPYIVTVPTLETLARYPFSQGNVDELKEIIEKMLVFRMGRTLTPVSIPKEVWDIISSQVHPEIQKSQIVRKLRKLRGAGENIVLPWNKNYDVSYDRYCELLLLELIRKIVSKNEHLGVGTSIRSLSKKLNIARETLNTKINQLIDRNLMTREELQSWNKVKKQEKLKMNMPSQKQS